MTNFCCFQGAHTGASQYFEIVINIKHCDISVPLVQLNKFVTSIKLPYHGTANDIGYCGSHINIIMVIKNLNCTTPLHQAKY